MSRFPKDPPREKLSFQRKRSTSASYNQGRNLSFTFPKHINIAKLFHELETLTGLHAITEFVSDAPRAPNFSSPCSDGQHRTFTFTWSPRKPGIWIIALDFCLVLVRFCILPVSATVTTYGPLKPYHKSLLCFPRTARNKTRNRSLQFLRDLASADVAVSDGLAGFGEHQRGSARNNRLLATTRDMASQRGYPNLFAILPRPLLAQNVVVDTERVSHLRRISVESEQRH